MEGKIDVLNPIDYFGLLMITFDLWLSRPELEPKVGLIQTFLHQKYRNVPICFTGEWVKDLWVITFTKLSVYSKTYHEWAANILIPLLFDCLIIPELLLLIKRMMV